MENVEVSIILFIAIIPNFRCLPNEDSVISGYSFYFFSGFIQNMQ